MLCYTICVMLYNVCHVVIQRVMLCYITCVMLYNMCDAMLYNMGHVMLYNMFQCHVTKYVI